MLNEGMKQSRLPMVGVGLVPTLQGFESTPLGDAPTKIIPVFSNAGNFSVLGGRPWCCRCRSPLAFGSYNRYKMRDPNHPGVAVAVRRWLLGYSNHQAPRGSGQPLGSGGSWLAAAIFSPQGAITAAGQPKI